MKDVKGQSKSVHGEDVTRVQKEAENNHSPKSQSVYKSVIYQTDREQPEAGSINIPNKVSRRSDTQGNKEC